MELRQLKSLCLIAKHGSVKEAGKRSFLTSSAVSLQIKMLEKELGITKEDIGKSISIEEYNAKCRATVMRYKAEWDDITRKMGYWVDLDHPYITYENNYIESVWYLLKQLYDQGLL